MSETSIPKPVAEVFVFMNEYSFRVEPGFVVARRDERLEFRNFTSFGVTLEFEPELYGQSIVLKPDAPDAPDGFDIGKEVRLGFHPYKASVEIGPSLSLSAIGGSGPGVIIKP